MRRLIYILPLLLLAACSAEAEPVVEEPVIAEEGITYDIDTSTLDVPYLDYLNDTNPRIAITFENYDPIILELFPDVAPLTVAQITSLVEQNFYDGIIFHRIISGFMIQGGDPTGTGGGGSGQQITGEFVNNGVPNRLRHWRGVLSMARSSDPNSASSQFFIVHQDSNFLDGDYAAFGAVILGFDTLDALATVETSDQDRPLEDVVMLSVRLLER
jgi:Peptidyl-prolyl cis-trans isomerase (rotamase) - cyclophilin family